MTRMSLSLVALLVASCTLAACATEPPTAPDAELLPVDGRSLAPGAVRANWMRVRYNVSGSATLAISGDTAYLELSSNFAIDQTPGPVLYLNTTNNPNTGRPLRIGALRSRQGAQTYAFRVPRNVQYQWLIIWCDPFNVPMAEAMLNRAATGP
jgi:hypothetical protein